MFFVGAGPGAPDLLTLRGAGLLQDADVVVHDGLVPSALLDAVGCHAERIPVPRTPEAGGDPGEETGLLLAGLAADGRMVVRLKGGDPSVFGRLSEEVRPLREAGCPFEIVPGVTAAVAAAAAAGMPLTSRSAASSLTIVTGHEADEKAESLDFSSLAGIPGTLAIYMGVEQAEKWSQALIQAGKPASTPVTVVSRCSLADQTVAQTTLGECAAAFDRCRWPAPAVVIVGAVAEAREIGTALTGRRVLITRPEGQGGELASMIVSRGGTCLHLPLIAIGPPASWEPLDRAILEADRFDWIVFASVNGVRSFAERMRLARRDGRHLGSVRLAAIGPATKRALEAAGYACDCMPSRFQSEGLLEALVGDRGGGLPRGSRLMLLRADRGRDLLRRELEAKGHEVAEIQAYTSRSLETIDPALLTALDRDGLDWITITSSAIAEAAVGLFGERLGSWKIASISPVTSATLRATGHVPAVEAREPTAAALVEAMADHEATARESAGRACGAG